MYEMREIEPGIEGLNAWIAKDAGFLRRLQSTCGDRSSDTKRGLGFSLFEGFMKKYYAVYLK